MRDVNRSAAAMEEQRGVVIVQCLLLSCRVEVEFIPCAANECEITVSALRLLRSPRILHWRRLQECDQRRLQIVDLEFGL